MVFHNHSTWTIFRSNANAANFIPHFAKIASASWTMTFIRAIKHFGGSTRLKFFACDFTKFSTFVSSFIPSTLQITLKVCNLTLFQIAYSPVVGIKCKYQKLYLFGAYLMTHVTQRLQSAKGS